MFTGIIESLGHISSIQRKDNSMTLKITPVIRNFVVEKGGSVAIDGVCLTAETYSNTILSFTAVFETLKHTTLETAKTGQCVNLERALCLQGRLDGHIVQGHVDGIGHIVSDQAVGESIYRTICIPEELRHFIVHKGSIAIDGISLTITQIHKETLTVSLIPYTYAETTMAIKKIGQWVNIECDIFARYIIQQMQFLSSSKDNTKAKYGGRIEKDNSFRTLLEKNGF